MRARHFIVEYSREKTAQVHGDQIIKVLQKDEVPGGNIDVWNLSQRSQQWDKLRPEDKKELLDKTFAQLEQGDPTKNKEYSQWLARMYSRGGTKLEDVISQFRDTLETYHTLKLKKKLEDQDKQIDKFKSFNELIARVEQYPEIEDDAPTDKGQGKEIYNDEHIRVIVPKDEAAACYYGQGTRWCTASKNNNMFKHYHKTGDMYIILPKKPQTPGEKYQFHFHSGQFMDASDTEVNMYDVVKRYPTLRNVSSMTEWAKRKMVPALMSDEDYAKWKKESDSAITHSQGKHGDMYTLSLNAATGSYDSWPISGRTLRTLIEKNMMDQEDWGNFEGQAEAGIAYGWFDAVSNKCLGVTYCELGASSSLYAVTVDSDMFVSIEYSKDDSLSKEPKVQKLEKFLNGLSRIEKERNSSGLADDQFKKGIDQMLDDYGYPVSLTGYEGGEPERA